jgi:hypothetical protein
MTAERFPRGGALTISLMGGAGMASVAIAVPFMGASIDRHGHGAALQMMAALGAILVVVVLGFLIYFKTRGPTAAAAPGNAAVMGSGLRP